MMDVFKKISSSIEKWEKKEDGVYLYSPAVKLKIVPITKDIIRIGATPGEEFAEKSDKIIYQDSFDEWSACEDEERVNVSTKALTVEICKKNGSLLVKDACGKILFSEKSKDAYEFEAFTSKKIAPGSEIKRETIQTADGKKEFVRAADMIDDKNLYHVKYNFCPAADEALYGLGQQESGGLNLRGRKLYLFQGNRFITVPVLVSSKGYGLLVNCGSPMIFEDNADGAYLYEEAVSAADYYFLGGDDINGVIKNYRLLTGKARLLPKWAFGYIQSKERYENQEEILEMADEFRDRAVPMDCLVLDWLSWRPDFWGEKQMDKSRFPDLKAMTDKLHEKNVHFMISIWPNPDTKSNEHEEFKKAGMLLPGSNVYNPFEKEGREIYGRQLERELLPGGVDAWWCDSSEPFTVEWSHGRRPLPEKNYAEYCNDISKNIPIERANEFCYYHALGAYEATRKNRKERVCNLTRSAFTGQQQFGTIMWSGDIGASWKTMLDQISQGLNFSITGIPYWTFDIGAFFVKTGEQWFWDGEYPLGEKDLAYRELFTRWYQLGSFMPVFRAHGTDVCREPWNVDPELGEFYKAIVKADELRYSLMPYIYSTAGRCYLEDTSIIAPLVQYYPADANVANIEDEFIFAGNLLVCPVVKPEYYDVNSTPIETAHEREVYLPAGNDWFDYYTGRRYSGGEKFVIQTKLDEIPLFVKDGSIIPVCKPGLFADDYSEIELRVYGAKQAEYTLYEDAGDGYEYENGEYSLRKFTYDGELKSEYVHGKEAAYTRPVAKVTVIA